MRLNKKYLSLEEQAHAHALNHLRPLVHQVNQLLPQGNAAFNQALQGALNTTDLWSLEQLQILLNANNPLLNPHGTEEVQNHLNQDNRQLLWENPIVRGDGTLWWDQRLHDLLNADNPNQLQLLKRVKAAAVAAVDGAHNLTAVNAPGEHMLREKLNQVLRKTLHKLWQFASGQGGNEFMNKLCEFLRVEKENRELLLNPLHQEEEENWFWLENLTGDVRGWLQNPTTDEEKVRILIGMLQDGRGLMRQQKEIRLAKKPLEQGLNLLWSLQRLQVAPPQQQ